MKLVGWCGGALLTSLVACFLGGNGTSGGDAGGVDSGNDIPPFQADPPSVYVAKVKNVLTGLAPTDAEVQQVILNPGSFVSLIDQWMQTPEYQSKMLEFFALAFQQTQIGQSDFNDQIPIGPGGIGQSPLIALLVQNAQESFARTAYEIVRQGRPFTDVFTTTTFMVTPPLLELYAFMDQYQVGDGPTQITDYFAKANPSLKITVEGTTPIAISKSLDPNDPNYMHWYFPGLNKVDKNGACNVDPRLYPAAAHPLHELMLGQLDNYTAGTTKCQTVAGTGANAQFTTADFSSWRMVNIRQPSSGEPTTRFYDIPALQTGSEVVLNTPRVSFYTTPAFFSNWHTNASNEMRVTVNQAFIVATSTQVDGTDTTIPAQTPGLDSQHVDPKSVCFSCHQTLDPSRAIFQSTYSYYYGQQPDPQLQAQKGQFTYRGVIAPINTIYDFGAQLATHPLVAQAWAQKLCFWLNSQACGTDDPEFLRIVGDFTSSKFSWTKLVEELASSPITTNASQTKTAQEEGELVAVSRKYHLCTALEARLGLTDVCGLDLTKGVAGVATIVSGLPSDQYGRGTPVPVLPNQPSMFYRAGLENMCEAIATVVVDPTTNIPGAKVYLSTSQTTIDSAVADFVANLMGIVDSDARAPALRAALSKHYTDSIGTGVKPTDALKSTFTLACLTPSVVGIGM